MRAACWWTLARWPLPWNTIDQRRDWSNRVNHCRFFAPLTPATQPRPFSDSRHHGTQQACIGNASFPAGDLSTLAVRRIKCQTVHENQFRNGTIVNTAQRVRCLCKRCEEPCGCESLRRAAKFPPRDASAGRHRINCGTRFSGVPDCAESRSSDHRDPRIPVRHSRGSCAV